MSSAADVPVVRSGRIAGLIRAIWSLMVGTLLSLTPVTAVIVLGWLTRRMRMVSLRNAGLRHEPPGWILGAPGTGFLARLLGGFAANIREGLLALVSLSMAVAPFAVIWLLSWWGGWENSFSKGYEQAFVGPSLGLGGVSVFCVIMIWLPMGLAHQAVENRGLALFQLRNVRSAVRHSGWGYLFMSAATVIAALPYFASRGLVGISGGFLPDLDQLTAEEVANLQTGMALVTSAYLFIALVVLRGWAARVYAAAVARALDGPEAALWENSPLAAGRRGGRRPWKLTHALRLVVLAVVWFGLAAQIFVAQFLNHDWHLWLNHPLIVLPWLG